MINLNRSPPAIPEIVAEEEPEKKFLAQVHSKAQPANDSRALKSAKDSAASLGVKSATSMVDRTNPVQDIPANDDASDFEIFESRKKLILLKAKRDRMLNNALDRNWIHLV